MIMQKHQIPTYVLLLAFVAALVVLATPTNAQQERPKTGVQPTTGPAGTLFAFYATGFQGEEPLVYWFNTPDGSVQGDPANYTLYSYRGRADWIWRAPDQATPGIWQAVIQSNRDDGINTQRIITFEITGSAKTVVGEPVPDTVIVPPDEHPAGAAVTPAEGPPGTRFSFFATDFAPHEQVSYWFNAPNGVIYGDPYSYVTHSFDGRADWRWTSPGDAQLGVWTAVALGKKTGISRVIEFRIISPSTMPQLTDNPPDVAVEPLIGAPGDRFAFSAAGFLPREIVYFWATSPDGTQYKKSKYKLRPNAEGVVYWNWRTPDLAARGIWSMYVMGEESQIQKRIIFEVR